MATMCLPIVALIVYEAHETRRESRAAAIVSYLAHPDFSNDKMLEQLTGIPGARMRLLDQDKGKLYVSIPSEMFGEESLKRLTVLPEKVEMGDARSGVMKLGPMTSLEKTRILLRFPMSSLRVDDSARARVSYGDIVYDPTSRELVDFIRDVPLYGGKRYAARKSPNLRGIVFANHGALVAKKEDSLRRLAARISANASSEEEKVQNLLSFVTDAIVYDHLDTIRQVHLLKRPNEVLLTGTATCSGKTILFASLLEQVGARYVLAYFPSKPPQPGHITVYVKGKFPRTNGYELSAGGEAYHLAETTAQGFRIGESLLHSDMRDLSAVYWQVPGKPVIDALTGTSCEMTDDIPRRR